MKLKKLIILLTIILGSMLSVQAQSEADAPATEEVAVADVQSKTLLDYWIIGGFTMYPLGLLSIACVSLTLYNAVALRRKKYFPQEHINNIEKLLNEKKIDEARAYCEEHPSPVTNIIGVGLSRADLRGLNIDDVEAAMEEASLEELAGPYSFVNYLSVVASVSPMLGLFGTVLGMVKAFDNIAAEGAGSAQKLANNISEALITTAAGMIIGIPSMLAFFYFKNKFVTITSKISRTVGDLTYVLTTSDKYGPQEIISSSTQEENK